MGQKLYNYRPLAERDLNAILEIEYEAFDRAWSPTDFKRCLKSGCYGTIVEHIEKKKNTLAGYMIYEYLENRIHLINFAVSNTYRKEGLGTKLLEKLKEVLTSAKYQKIFLEVRETNLRAQHFFQKNQFEAVSIHKKYYDDTDEDAYLMVYPPHRGAKHV